MVCGKHAAPNIDDPFTDTTAITWTVTDACGNTASQVQTVTVLGYNDFLVDIQLQPSMAAAVTRCITFTFYDCDGERWRGGKAFASRPASCWSLTRQ